MNEYRYKTSGTCSKEIILQIEDGIIKEVKFVGGCPGNTQGVATLCKNRPSAQAVHHNAPPCNRSWHRRRDNRGIGRGRASVEYHREG